MINFVIAGVNNLPSKYDAALVKSLLSSYMDGVAAEFNSVVNSRDVSFTIEFSVTNDPNINAASGNGMAWDSAKGEWFNPIEQAIKTGNLKGLDKGVNISFSLSDGMVKNMIDMTSIYGVSAKGGLGIFMHEFGHTVSFNSYRNDFTGDYSAIVSTYDKQISFNGGTPYYVGRFGKAVYNDKPIELYPLGFVGKSLSHFAYTSMGINDPINYDMMQTGTGASQIHYSDVDLGVLKDCGYSVKKTLVSYDKKNYVLGDFGAQLVGTGDINTVFVQGKKSEYVITNKGDVLSVLSKLSGETQSFSGIERLAFDDLAVAFDIDGKGGEAYRLYQAAFDRKPDLPGLGYWVKELTAGMPLSNVAASFLLSNEFKAKYGDSLSDGDFLTALYSNVLHRAPDQAGYNWWMNQMHSGIGRETVLASFSESVENKAQVIGSIINGFEFIPY